jgi:ribosome-binding factor A
VSELRTLRVEEQLQREIMSLILSGDVKDPRVNSFLSVTRVEAARDFTYAKVFISTFQGGDALVTGVAGLNSAAPYLQAMIGKRLRMRSTPKLRFEADYGVRDGFALTNKMKDL